MTYDLFSPPVQALTVSELTAQVKGAIEESFPHVWVCGELTGFKKHQSGHWYFSLKDAGAVLPSAMFRGANKQVKIDPRDGMEVLARGALNVYPPQGRYQLIVEELIPKGLGAQELALKKLKEKLLKQGYFAPERKKPLPSLPRRLALVTSPSGAAVRDILEILARRWPAVEVWICPVHVQGDIAPGEIAEALSRLNRVGGVDVIILGRGGGSAEDLSAFNDERVADAIFRSRIPIVSAVGHEIDITIADLVADKRALTPSEAAELVVPDRMELLKKVAETNVRLRGLMGSRFAYLRQRLDDIDQRRVFRRPVERIRDLEQRLDGLGDRLQRGIRQRLQGLRQLTAAAAARLESLSPLNVLARGYSLTRRASDQKVVRAADQLAVGDLLVTILQHGQLKSRVEEITPR
ncbi:MAG TPA: exodeoxyribonuclease VII large subunit [Gemmataceae bacterium]|nr:exodeoxyribonuclease VII large subunit [Gemmataceae bacterium]